MKNVKSLSRKNKNMTYHNKTLTNNFKLMQNKQSEQQLKISNVCNNNCSICKFLDKKSEEKSLEEIKNFINLTNYRENLIISGGEPALRKDIFEIVSYAKAIGFKKIILETNGRIFSYRDFCKEMILYGVDQFNVYLYSHESEVHDKITKVKGSWKQTIEGIRNLVDMKQNIQINLIISKQNFKGILDTVCYLNKLKINNLYLIFLEQIKIDKIMPEIIRTVKYAVSHDMKITFNKNILSISIVSNEILVAPTVVQFSLTNACNNSCVYCNNYSPYLDKKTRQKLVLWKKAMLDIAVFKKFVDDLVKMGTKNIQISGEGEPFMHPQIMEMIKYAKEKGIEKIEILTNFNLVNKKILNQIIDYKVDEIRINLSAGTAETYVRVHPNQNLKSFKKLIKDICFLTNKRKIINDIPRISIVFAICSLNYYELYDIAKLAKKIKANFIEFKIIETTPPTRKLQLTKKQFNKIKYMFGKVKKFLDDNKIESNIGSLEKLFKIEIPKDEFTDNLYKTIGCFIGWYYCFIKAHNLIAPCTLHSGLIKINNRSFVEIWTSKEYNLFRKMALDKKWRQNNVFSGGCIRCPFYTVHLEIYNELKKSNLLKFLK